MLSSFAEFSRPVDPVNAELRSVWEFCQSNRVRGRLNPTVARDYEQLYSR